MKTVKQNRKMANLLQNKFGITCKVVVDKFATDESWIVITWERADIEELRFVYPGFTFVKGF